MSEMKQQFYYKGFSSPNGTIVPDDVFDVLMPQLTNPELRVLLYIIRRTFGFKKNSDNISLNQMVNGIRTRDGRVLDEGTGLSKASVARGVNGLIEKGVVVATRNQSTAKGYEATTYHLRFKDDSIGLANDQGPRHNNGPPSNKNTTNTPLSHSETRAVPLVRHALVSPVDPQQTVEQQTDKQLSKLRKVNTEKKKAELVGSILDRRSVEPTCGDSTPSDRDILTSYMQSIAIELRDQSSLRSTVTRLLRIYERSQLESIEAFINVLYKARSITKEHTGSVRGGEPGARRLVPYFIRVVEDLVGLKENDRRSDTDTP